jgi:hypothetical protein
MDLIERVKGLLFAPQAEWEAIEKENTSVPDLYRRYIAILAALPPFATFLGGWLFGYARGHHGVAHPTFVAGLTRAAAQYLLSLPALYLVAFVISSVAPQFDGKSDDRRALALVAYSYTPAWLASLFGLVPGLRWLDILGFYGLWLFHLGLTRMMRCPEDNEDVFTLIALFLVVAVAALHAWIVHVIAPAQLI